MSELIDKLVALGNTKNAPALEIKATLLLLVNRLQADEKVEDADWLKITGEMRSAILLTWAAVMLQS